MFITRKIILGISVLISGIILVIVFQNRRNKKWFDTHKYIQEISKQESYTIKQITKERVGYYYNDTFATKEEQQEYYRDTNPKERFGGHIFYDTVQQTFWVEANGYIKSEEGDGSPYEYMEYNEWINFDKEGQVITRKKEVDSLAHKNLVLLKNEIKNFYKWDDTSTLFYVQHFAREKFIWSSLNPLHGYGNPIGGSPTTYWQGVAYLKLQMQKSILQFKTKTESRWNGYDFRIDLYRLPEEYSAEAEIAFVNLDEKYLNNADKGLYVITHVNH